MTVILSSPLAITTKRWYHETVVTELGVKLRRQSAWIKH